MGAPGLGLRGRSELQQRKGGAGRGVLRGPPQNGGPEMRQHQRAQEAPQEGSWELWGNETEAPALLVLATTPTTTLESSHPP